MTLFYVHAALMSSGFLLFLTALVIAATQRNRRWWLRVHRTVGGAGTVAIMAGAAAALALVSPGGIYLQSPHAWLGLLTIVLALATPVLGVLQLQIPRWAPRLRALHRPGGRLLTLSALVTILMGLRLAGLL